MYVCIYACMHIYIYIHVYIYIYIYIYIHTNNPKSIHCKLLSFFPSLGIGERFGGRLARSRIRLAVSWGGGTVITLVAQVCLRKENANIICQSPQRLRTETRKRGLKSA